MAVDNLLAPERRPPVAVVGIGNMGLAMATRLLSQGWPVHVCDIDPTRGDMALALGAVVHATPAQAVAALAPGGLLVVAVVDAAQCREVLWGEGGAAAALQPGQAVMWCPTIAPADLESLAERLATQGVDSLDAPMSGGPARARDGSMSLLLAGADTVVQRYARVLAALSGQVVRLGERLGDGARTKLVNNLLAGINLVGAAEAMALAHNLGLDAQRTLEVIERSSGQSWIGSDRLPRALAGDLLPRAHMTLLAKDTRLACEAASAAGFAGPLGERVASVFRMACEGGLSELDDAAMLIFLQQTGQSR
ncbi:MAG: NAD(P)-dependent oxidoreductase [Burkholderiaceae bacterium]|nr:NAD(P)-dependent oxidoreductase [Burkholderiaceae bacterium]